jgi:micrococcal nuclease
MTDVPDFLYWYRARCLRVVDGDTIDVLTDLGFRIGWEQRVRLYGVDTYELNDPDPTRRALAVEGKAFVASRIEGKDVILNTFKDRGDKYCRWLAVARYFADDGTWHNLSEELLIDGLTVASKS